MPRFVIAHMEKKLYKWAQIEYEYMAECLGKKNLLFTNLTFTQAKNLAGCGQTTTELIEKIRLNKPCILDPSAEKILTPEDAKHFSDFIFGGILGDYPPQKRTKEIIKLLPDVPTRNLGKEQMSTDTAVYVTKKIIDDISLDKMKFQDELTIVMDDSFEQILPYRYVIEDGKVVISEKLLNYLIKKKGF